MIRIEKGAAPAVLARAADHLALHAQAFDADPDAFRSGSSKFEHAKLYSHPDVKAALDAAQHGKCCFCEVIIPLPYADGHVEHWRPKGAYKQNRGDRSTYPGYYWLAYEWTNLFLSCRFCNVSNKSVLFPLLDPGTRAHDHHGNTDLELPAMLKPDGPEDPRDHIRFKEEFPKGLTERGRWTIEVLGLSRIEHRPRKTRLNELKKAREQILRYRQDLTPAAVEIVGDAYSLLARAILPDAPFSAMAIDFLDANPLPARVS